MGHCEKKDPTEAEPFYEKYKNETNSITNHMKEELLLFRLGK